MRFACMSGAFRVVAVPLAIVAVAGCATTPSLREMNDVPMFVRSYTGANLLAKTKDVPCRINLDNCPDVATIAVTTFSGTMKIGPNFPLKDIVTEEFAAVVYANFNTQPKPDLDPLELVVEPQMIRCVRDGDNLTCHVAVLLTLRSPQKDGEQHFRKRYDCVTHGVVYDEQTLHPCVYEAFQRIASNFVNDLDGDVALLARFDAMTP